MTPMWIVLILYVCALVERVSLRGIDRSVGESDDQNAAGFAESVSKNPILH